MSCNDVRIGMSRIQKLYDFAVGDKNRKEPGGYVTGVLGYRKINTQCPTVRAIKDQS